MTAASLSQHETTTTEATKRNVICVSGIRIDELDYSIVEQIFPSLCLEDLMKQRIFYQWVIEISDDDDEKGFRVRKLRIPGVSGEPLPELIMALDALETLYLDIYEKPEWIGGLRNLKHLQLGCFEISEWESVPEEIGRLTGLETLCLRGTQVVTLPSSINKLVNLKVLDLSASKKLRSLPDILGQLTNLEKLDISGTSIESLPASIGKLTNLKSLDLSYNHKLQIIPEEIGGLVRLEKLDLTDTEIASLPRSLSNLEHLKELDLSMTEKLRNIPDDIGKLTGLEALSLIYSAVPSIPSSVGNLINLKALLIPFPSRSEDLPSRIGRLKNLEFFEMSFADGLDHDTIPSTLSRMTSILSEITNLKALGLPPEVYEIEDSYPVLCTVVKRCPYLGCLGGKHQCRGEHRNCSRNLDAGLLRNRLDSLAIHPGVSPALWPWILARANRVSSWSRQICCEHQCWNSIPEPDAIFHLLVGQGGAHVLSERAGRVLRMGARKSQTS